MPTFIKRLLKSLFMRTPLRSYFQTRLLPKQWRLFLVNWFFQRILGMNREMPHLVHFTSQTVQASKVHLSDNIVPSLFLAGHCYIQAGNSVFIGSNCLIAPGVKIISANHDPGDPKRRWTKTPPIRIGSDCWIGANAVVLPGVSIGDRAVVGASAVVTADVPSGAVVVGNPARIIRYLTEES